MSDAFIVAVAAALVDAFIKTILSAPVKLALKPKRIANAGTKIIDVMANPAPNIKALVLTVCADTA